MDLLYILLTISSLAIEIYCCIKEPKITGYYKAMNIYGRIYAVIASSILGSFITSIFVLIAVCSYLDTNIGELLEATLSAGKSKDLILNAVSIIIWLIVGIYMYYRVFKLSPSFMKKRCLFDLTVSGIGVTARIVFWFVGLFVSAWWAVAMPNMYVLDNGRSVYVFPNGKVFDSANNRFGTVTDDKTAVIWDKSYN